ncbi:MAG: ABC transporter permease, partial [Candidatus Omnitrophica bacterium]|nr:ABC transporter permease [Candidatus Omnitrophota bacterium]
MEFVRYAGGASILLGQTLFWIPMPPLRRRQLVDQMSRIGVDSLPIVSLISLFTGMVLALQSAYQMQKMSA